MSTEIVDLVEQATPYLSAALTAYGAAVLSRAEDTAVSAAVEGTAGLGQRILQLVWRRRDEEGRAALEEAVQTAAEEPDDTDAAGALRHQLKRALREEAELVRELAALLPEQASVTVNVSGTRAIGAQHIGIAASGDNTTIHPPQQ
ncbi:hypothetical protein G9272_12015 [Streptomyces asoensis]|uniref:Uncharacterized protein n=1 Tax=Streptomyces asoensis TaxID=249586 RepID=A0A6M4WKT3_9ACTN|nr:hypothetical protein [Streptomyces asoensis]QJT00944.1 hypothetical protein G9272_12015 [Streptomyces asoensis]